MPRAVVILGAGASAPFGVPTLASLFKDPYARRHLAEDPLLREHLQNTFWGLRGYDLESSHLTVTVEDILTILRDYDTYPDAVASPLGNDRDAFRRSLYVLIKKAVYDGKSSNRGRHLNPLIGYAGQMFEHTTWASFNWDCIFESSFYYSSGDGTPGSRYNPTLVIPVNDWRPGTGKHAFLKLHGGVNWWFENGAVRYLPFGGKPDLDRKWDEYQHGHAQGSPVILEPSCYKYEDPVFEILKPQWTRFLRELMDADRVFVIGYSLPESDAQARTVLTIGFQSGKAGARWIVVNRSDEVCNKFARLFGTANVKTLTTTLEEFSRDIPGMDAP